LLQKGEHGSLFGAQFLQGTGKLLLGALFRYRETKTTKTNLMVFLRPLVIRSAEDGYRITSDRYEYLRPQTTTRQNEEVLNRLTPKRPTAEKDGLLGPPNVPDEFSR